MFFEPVKKNLGSIEGLRIFFFRVAAHEKNNFPEFLGSHNAHTTNYAK